MVYGQDVVVSIYNSGTSTMTPIGCARSCTFDISRDTIETSSIGNGQFRTYISGPISYSGTIEGLVFLGDTLDSNAILGMGVLYDYMITGNEIILSFYEIDIDNNYLQKSLNVIFESISETASFDNVATFTANFKGTGLPTITHGTT